MLDDPVADVGYCHTEEFAQMLRQAGFRQVKFLPINEHTSAVIAYKWPGSRTRLPRHSGCRVLSPKGRALR